MQDTRSNAKVKLSYFDFSGSRGEECRLALHLAGIDFHDNRIKGKDWPAKKPGTPFGGVPVLEIAGLGVLAQSNAILGFIGAQHGLLPDDAFEAARHHAILNAVEDVTTRIAPALRLDGDAKKAAREELGAGYLKHWSGNLEAMIVGPFVAGEWISVADIKLYVLICWIERGYVDHIPPGYFADFAKLFALYRAVGSHPKVVEFENREPQVTVL
ncbi:MAG: glutathione S-transferase family protein [Paracoccaceae bacterium]